LKEDCSLVIWTHCILEEVSIKSIFEFCNCWNIVQVDHIDLV